MREGRNKKRKIQKNLPLPLIPLIFPTALSLLISSPSYSGFSAAQILLPHALGFQLAKFIFFPALVLAAAPCSPSSVVPCSLVPRAHRRSSRSLLAGAPPCAQPSSPSGQLRRSSSSALSHGRRRFSLAGTRTATLLLFAMAAAPSQPWSFRVRELLCWPSLLPGRLARPRSAQSPARPPISPSSPLRSDFPSRPWCSPQPRLAKFRPSPLSLLTQVRWGSTWWRSW
jgi:hypothetical protein